jgi:hypothetical protein
MRQRAVYEVPKKAADNPRRPVTTLYKSPSGGSVRLTWSPVNQIWFLLWPGDAPIERQQILSTFQRWEDGDREARRITESGAAENPRPKTYTVSVIPTESEGWRYAVKSDRGGTLDTRGGYQTRGEAEGAAHAWLRRFIAGDRFPHLPAKNPVNYGLTSHGESSTGISYHADQDEPYLALTLTDSKYFKTLSGATQWLAKRGYDVHGRKVRRS